MTSASALADQLDTVLMRVADGSLNFADFVDAVVDLVSEVRRTTNQSTT